MSDVAAAWAQLIAWYQGFRPGWRPTPINGDTVERLRVRYSDAVPAQWLESLRVHDGDVEGLFGEFELGTGAGTFACDQNDDGFAGWPGWPVAGTEERPVIVCIAATGEVIEWQAGVRVVANSYGDWLGQRAADVKSGRVVWHPIRERPVPLSWMPNMALIPLLVGDVEAVANRLVEALSEHGTAEISGAGTLVVVREGVARVGVNPSTGHRISIKPRRRVRFEPTVEFSSAVAGVGPAPAQEPGRSIAVALAAGERLGWPLVGEIGRTEASVAKHRMSVPEPWFWLSPAFRERALAEVTQTE